MIRKTLLLYALFATALAGTASAQELPLKRVMLSTGGVGYFEHEAEIEGNAEISLDVRLDQVDDVLKSIVVYDGAGMVGTISLPGREPLRQAFRDLPFGEDALGSPAALLEALKGAEVAVSGPREIAGRVFSITRETVKLPQTGETLVHHRVTLYTRAGLESFILEEAQAVRIADAGLQAQVDAALAAIARHRVRGRRTLTIRLAGEGRRAVRIAYVVPTPLWKATYRLTLDGKPDGGQSHLQGWAVVENMTGRDWRDVDLALVSGNPVTFRQAIYTSYYVNRPEVPVEVLGRILPRPDKGTVGGAGLSAGQKPKTPTEETDRLDRRRALGKSESRDAMGRAGQMLAAPAEEFRDASPNTAEPVARSAFQASGRESATQVVFRIPRPISIASGHSLVVPIIDRNVPVERVSLYQPATHGDHPVGSARISNSAETGLPGGVLTIFGREGRAGAAAYLGDAQLRTLPPGESRLVGFALDEKVRIEREIKRARSIAKGSISRGVFHHTVIDRQTTVYRLKGAAAEPRSVILEHTRRPGWSLESPDPKSPEVELAEGVYRIAVSLKPGEERRLEAVTVRPRQGTIGLSNLRADRVAAFAATDTLSDEVRAAFRRMADLMAAIEGHKAEVGRLEKIRQDIFQDQQRIRENMRRVNNQRSELYQRYVRKLTSQESELDALTGKVEAARDAQRKAERALADYIASLDV